MKFSINIVIFLILSCLSAAFHYALKKTDGNVFKALQFALLYLAIKLGLIGLNIPGKLNQYQPTQQLVDRVAYNRYIPSLKDNNLYMHKIKQPVYERHLSDHSKSLIRDLRAGDLTLKQLAILVFTFWMWQHEAIGFQPPAERPPHHQLFGDNTNFQGKNYFSKSGKPIASLQMEKPSSMSHSQYISLTKEEKRNLPHPLDRVIQIEGRSTLIARYGQVKYKTPAHGKIHGLQQNENGKTLKTETNIACFLDSLTDMPNRKNLMWYEDGAYQKGTDRGYESVNLYDKDSRVIAIYKKQENGECLFSTTCRLTIDEETHLLENNGSFVTEAVLNNQTKSTINDINTNDL